MTRCRSCEGGRGTLSLPRTWPTPTRSSTHWSTLCAQCAGRAPRRCSATARARGAASAASGRPSGSISTSPSWRHPDRPLPSPPLSAPRHLCRRRPCHLPPTSRRPLAPPRRALLRSAHGGRARAARADQRPHVCHGGGAAAAGGRRGRQRGQSGAGARHTAGDAPLHASVASHAQGAVARRRTARARARAKCCARKCAPGPVAARRLCVPSHTAHAAPCV